MKGMYNDRSEMEILLRLRYVPLGSHVLPFEFRLALFASFALAD